MLQRPGCLIEDNFDCNITYCWETIPPKAEIESLDADLILTIKFSEQIKSDLVAFKLDNTLSKIEGELGEYIYFFSIVDSSFM